MQQYPTFLKDITTNLLIFKWAFVAKAMVVIKYLLLDVYSGNHSKLATIRVTFEFALMMILDGALG